ncbi:MAG TPA: rhomboid family intramembrane serine protease [Steroidobacteraceae bacterium]|nr:rhomboid family intramembrane serine protease [Steroidobacteraceae bacterium]
MNISAILLIIAWACTLTATLMTFGSRTRRRPILTLAICGLTGVGLLTQLLHPTLLAALERDRHKMLHGEWWRAFTALFVQDGWLPGGLTNLSALLLLGGLAEQVLRRLEWMVIYSLGALVAEGVALAWQPVGGGNSVAVCSLAGALLALRPPAARAPSSSILRTAALASAALLVVLRDIHGVAILAGTALEAGLFAQRPRT